MYVHLAFIVIEVAHPSFNLYGGLISFDFIKIELGRYLSLNFPFHHTSTLCLI